MSHTDWILYGATGFTGAMIAEEAIKRGHKPVLAGRSAKPLAELGARLGLPWVAVGLDEPDKLRDAIRGGGAVLNAAGPFGVTAPPLVEACLKEGVHYLDIAGEIPVMQHLFSRDGDAREKRIALVGGVGFGVTASNGLVKMVADLVPGATTLEVAVKADNQGRSQGAAKTTLEVLAKGGRAYRDGRLMPLRLGSGLKTLRFPDGNDVDILPVPSGDLEAAYQTTGIPNITAYIPFRRAAAMMLPAVQLGLSIAPIRRQLEAAIDRRGGHQAESQASEPKQSYVWAKATSPDGRQAEAWLELGEGYHFTAASSVRAVEQVLRGEIAGTVTPAEAFGADFALQIEGVRQAAGPVPARAV